MTTRITMQAGEIAAMDRGHRPALSRLCERARSVEGVVANLSGQNPSTSDRGSSDLTSS
jgi:hypothetical protein